MTTFEAGIEHMPLGEPCVVALMVSIGVTLVAVPVVRRVAIGWSLYDRPDAGLKSHTKPIPYLGGVGMYLGWLAALGVVTFRSGRVTPALGGIVLAGTVLMLTGLVDDLRHLRPAVRLVLQAFAAAILLAFGVGRHVITAIVQPFMTSPSPGLADHPVMIALSGLLTVAVLLSASNATNLIDGLDGLCAGVVAVAAAGYAAFGVGLAPAVGQPAATAVILAVVVTGVCLGFLRYNFHPASIFMGDSGSLLLGFNAAVLMILLAEQPVWTGGGPLGRFAGAVMVFGFPVFDTALAILRRRLNGKPLFIGDRSHFYDQLRDRGLSVRRTVVICYGLGFCFGGLGLMAMRLPGWYLLTAYGLVVVLALLVCRRLGLLRVDNAAEKSKRQNVKTSKFRHGGTSGRGAGA
ncbi:MAG: MraY family glycosyltransferase [Phycisphaerae bacterium]